MELTINGHNMEVTQRLSNYVEKKTGRLDRYMPNLAEIH
ncbi:MAG: HPF/RaiA family ribosome-associated protein, partial [Anaerolineae bacterium]